MCTQGGGIEASTSRTYHDVPSSKCSSYHVLCKHGSRQVWHWRFEQDSLRKKRPVHCVIRNERGPEIVAAAHWTSREPWFCSLVHPMVAGCHTTAGRKCPSAEGSPKATTGTGHLIVRLLEDTWMQAARNDYFSQFYIEAIPKLMLLKKPIVISIYMLYL